MHRARYDHGVPSSARVVMALEWYSHLYHRGIARYAREARWMLDAASVHAGNWHLPTDAAGVVGVFTTRNPLLEAARRKGIPVVDMCLVLPDIRLPRVLQDNEGIGRAAAEHFVLRGFRHFIFGSPYRETWSSAERLHGYRNALLGFGFDCLRIVAIPRENSARSGAGLIRSLARQLRDIPLPCAILAHNDDFAIEILQACESATLDVPSDVAIVGCDNDELVCDFAQVPLSSVDSNLEQQAYEAARLLGHLMSGTAPPAQPIRIEHRGIVTRQSSDVLAISHTGLTRAIDSIWKRYSDPLLSVERLAEEAGMTRQGLDRACVRHLGRTISKEIKRVRQQNALALLRGSPKRIAVIARQCGYSRAKHLRDTILRETGMTPTAFRRSKQVKTPLVPDRERCSPNPASPHAARLGI